MGAVWAAENLSTGREVALKLILRSTEHLRKRLWREARAGGKLQHRNVIEIFDVGETDEGDPFLVMPLLSGETLKARIVREGRFTPQVAARIGRDVARALSAAHGAGVIHRDLKPANIFLHQETDADDGPVVKVLDFGVCKDLNPIDGIATIGGGMVGSLAYISPEQAKVDRTLDHRTDLWSFGVILFEMLAGSRPFKGTASDILPQLFFEDIPRVESIVQTIDPALSALVARCLERDRDKRISSAAEIAATLHRFVTPSAEIHLDAPLSFAPQGSASAAPSRAAAPEHQASPPAVQSAPPQGPPPAPGLLDGDEMDESEQLTIRYDESMMGTLRKSQPAPPPPSENSLAATVAMPSYRKSTAPPAPSAASLASQPSSGSHGSPGPRRQSAPPAAPAPMPWQLQANHPGFAHSAGPSTTNTGGPLGQGGTVKMSTDFAHQLPRPPLGPPPAPPPPSLTATPLTIDPMLISNSGTPSPPSPPSRKQLGIAMAIGIGVGAIGLLVIYNVLSSPPKAPPAPTSAAPTSPIAPTQTR